MTARQHRGAPWVRREVAFLVLGIAGWVALISALHLRGVWGGATKGAGELLEIGALPVT